MAARAGLGSAQAYRDGALAELQRSARRRSRALVSSQVRRTAPCAANPWARRSPRCGPIAPPRSEAARQRLAAAEIALAGAATACRGGTCPASSKKAPAPTRSAGAPAWQQVSARRAAAAERLKSALEAVAVRAPATVGSLGPAPAPGGSGRILAGCPRRRSQPAGGRRRRPAGSGDALKGARLAESALAQAEERATTAASLVEVLRAKVRALAFDQDALVAAREALTSAEAAASESALAATGRRAKVAIKARAEAEAANQRGRRRPGAARPAFRARVAVRPPRQGRRAAERFSQRRGRVGRPPPGRTGSRALRGADRQRVRPSRGRP